MNCSMIKKAAGAAVAVALSLFTRTGEAALASHGPINPQNGFPTTYTDANGLALKIGLEGDGLTGFSVYDPITVGNNWSAATGFGAEAFYWMAEALFPLHMPGDALGVNSGQGIVVLALEASYSTGIPANNDQSVFSRVRVRMDTPVAGNYTVIHPYGTETFAAAPQGRRGLNATRDITLVPISAIPTAFDFALNGDVGPFLTWTAPDYPVVNPATGTQHVGNPQIPHAVTGSPLNQNYVMIQGPAGSNLDGLGNDFILVTQFTVAGMIEPSYALTVASIPAGGGTVSVSPAPHPVTGKYTRGAVVTLTATPAAGFDFISWSGAAIGALGSIEVVMDADKSVTANFASTRRALAFDAVPVGGGAVSAVPAPDPDGLYANGTAVTLTATPAAGFTFANWSGAAVGALASVEVVMDADKSVTANFDPIRRALTLTPVPAEGGSIGAVPAPDPDGFYADGAVVTLTATPAAGFSFSSWSGDAVGGLASVTVTLDADKSVTAGFTPVPPVRRALTLDAGPAGGGTVAASPAPDADGFYAEGTVVTLTATPAAGFTFSSWSGGAAGSVSPVTVTLNANVSVTAAFAAIPPARRALTFGAIPAEGGTVSAAPAPDPDGFYADGTVVTLTATPAAGYTFSAWSGGAAGTLSSVTVTLDADKTVAAAFTAVPPVRRALALDAGPAGGGAISAVPAPDPDGLYADGVAVTLTATPAAGFTFASWSGAAAGTVSPVTVTLTANASVTATFAAIPPARRTLTLGAVPAEGGTVSAVPAPDPDGFYANGTVVTLTATPAAGYTFSAWSGGAAGTLATVAVTLDADKTVAAAFTAVPPARRALALDAGPAGGGAISAEPAPDPDGLYADGVAVTLTATPAAGFTFASWSGAAAGAVSPVTVTLNANASVTATFAAIPPARRALTLSPQPAGGGAISAVPAPDPDGFYADGAMVTLTATPAAGYTFSAWSGGAAGTLSSVTVTLDADKTVAAAFTAVPPVRRALALDAGPAGGGAISAEPAPDPDGLYADGVAVTLTATPAAGFTFASWSGAAAGAVSPVTVTLTANASVTATFAAIPPARRTLTLSPQPAGGGAINAVPAPDPDGFYANGTVVTLTATPAAGYAFSSWGGAVAGTLASAAVTLDADKTALANFTATPVVRRSLGLNALPVGRGTISAVPAPDADGLYADGAVVTLTAVPADGYDFSFWSGGAAGNAATLEVTLNANKAVTANFEVERRALTLGVQPAGGGTISAVPAPGADGLYTVGTVVTLTANPAVGKDFTSWSGDAAGAVTTVAVTMGVDKTVTANFAVARRALTLSAVPAAGGTVTALPPADGDGLYAYGTVVTLTATAAVGYDFVSWSGDAAGALATTEVTVTDDRTVSANFTLARRALTLGIDPVVGGTLSVSPAAGPDGLYAFGTVVTLTATPAANYTFGSWTGDAAGSVTPVEVAMDANKTVTANFTAVPRALTLGVLPAGSGSIGADPAPDAGGNYAHGTVVTLTATPAAGYDFVSWSGAASGAVSPVTVIADADKAVTANFALTPVPELSVTPANQAVPKGAGLATFAVANIGVGTLAWTAEIVEGGAWARITAGASGSDAGAVTVGFDANPVDGAARVATVRITAVGAAGSPADVTLTQAENPAGSVIVTSIPLGVPFEMPLPPAFAEAARVTVRGLPLGLRFDADARTIAGVPTRPGVFASGVISAAGVASQPLQITVEALPAWALGTFIGEAGTPELGSGSATMSVSAAGKIAGKISLAGKIYSFSAPAYGSREADGSFRLTTVAKNAAAELPLTLAVSAPVITDATGVVPATLGRVDGNLGEGGAVLLYRNVWKDAGMPAALTAYVGYYTATLPGGPASGSGYLAFTVSAVGAVKTTGKLADGTAVTLSAPLILDEAGRAWTVVYTAPVAYKGGSLFGAAQFVIRDGQPTVVSLLNGEPFAWKSLNPQATGDFGAGFDRVVGLSGGFYNKLVNLLDYYANGVTVGGVALPTLAAPVKLVTDTVVNGVDVVTTVTETRVFGAAEAASPNGLALGIKLAAGVGTGIIAPKAVLPVLDEVTEETYIYEGNTSGLTMLYTRATGLFSGSFKAWYDYASVVEIDPLLGEVPDILAHVAKPVKFQGVLTPVNAADVPEGRGYFLWADKGVNPAATRPYAFSESYDFLLLAN